MAVLDGIPQIGAEVPSFALPVAGRGNQSKTEKKLVDLVRIEHAVLHTADSLDNSHLSNWQKIYDHLLSGVSEPLLACLAANFFDLPRRNFSEEIELEGDQDEREADAGAHLHLYLLRYRQCSHEHHDL